MSVLQKLVPAAAILCVWGSVASADLVINRFDSAAELSTWRYDFGGAGSAPSWNSTEDAGGGAVGSGSLQLDFVYPNNGVAFTSDYFTSPGMDLSSFLTVSFDVKVDPASATDAFGNNGYLQFANRNTDSYTWVEQLGIAANVNDANGWVNLSSPVTGAAEAVRAFTVQLYGGASQNLPGPVTLYVDNLVFTSPIPEPSSLALLGLAGGLLAAFRRFRS